MIHTDNLVMKVLKDMEVIKYRLDMRTLILKCFLKIGVHVAGKGFHTVHPFKADMLNEVINCF